MIKNEMNKDAIKTAFKKWATKTDGYDYAIGGILGEIPWGEDINRLMDWEDVCDKFDECIGNHKMFDMTKIINGDISEILALDKWATEKTNALYDLYDSVIKEINEKNRKCVVIKKCVGVVNGVCQYEDVEKFCGYTWYPIFENIFIKYSYAQCLCWEHNMYRFFDACYNAVYNNTSVHIGMNEKIAPLGLYLYIPKKQMSEND